MLKCKEDALCRESGRGPADSEATQELDLAVLEGRDSERAERQLEKEREKAERYLRIASVIILALDVHGNITLINDKGCEVLEITRQEALGLNWFDTFLPPDARDEAKSVFRNILGGREPDFEYFENPVVTRGGCRRIVQWHNSVVLDDAGQPTGTLSSGQDVTEARHAEEALRASKANFRALYQGANEAIFVHDIKTGQILDVNRKMTQMFGYTPKQAQELTVNDLSDDWPCSTEDGAHPQIKPADPEMSPVVECIVKTKEGRRFWAEVGLTCATTGGDNRGLTVVRDISARRQTEASLWKSRVELAIRDRINKAFLTVADEKMYRAVLDIVLDVMDSPLGVFGYIDERGDLVVPSLSTQAMHRCRVADKTITFPKETWGSGTWARCLREKEPVCRNTPSDNLPAGHIGVDRHISLPIIHRGEPIGLLQVANRQSDYDEEDIELLATISRSVAPVLQARLERDRKARERDLGERKLAALVIDLQRSNRDLEQFAHIVSHDLQEPLRMVSSYTDLLARRYQGRLDADADDFIRFASDGAKRMQRLIQDLLAYSRVTTRGNPLKPVNCEAVLQQVLLNLKVVLGESGGQVTHDPLRVIVADEVQIGQLFQNLIANAVKFRGPRSLKVHVSMTDVGTDWRFTVSDNGIGIDPKYKDRIFGVFQRLEASRKASGTGIGLAVCKRIVERHGGRIWLDTVIRDGATFHFTVSKCVVPEFTVSQAEACGDGNKEGRPAGAENG